MTADREKVIKGLEEISDYFFSVYRHSEDREEIDKAKDRCDAVEDAIALLGEQTTWMCHLYRCGDKRFECSRCHGTSWKDSDYCPDCGTRMSRVVKIDD